MKNLLLILSLSLLTLGSFAQKTYKYYNPEANAKTDLKKAITKADAENKHVFVIIGGNWCPWCIKFSKYIEQETEIKNLLEKEYVIIKVNYSKENKNMDVLEDLQYPNRFGFPVFVILDKDGKKIHTQDSGYLEKDKGYDKAKVSRMLKNWTTTALDPETYKKK